MQIPSWIASGPGSDWHMAMASRICSLISHSLPSTSSRTIRPTGPPKPGNLSLKK
jgi:hypothetical protein